LRTVDASVMMSFSSKFLIILLLSLLAWELSNSPADFVQIELPSIFADNMVLQRDHANVIWGKATPRELIEVHLADKRIITTVNTDRSWSVTIPPLPAGGPYELTITGFKQVTLHNVAMGDVWVCAGQSNMGMELEVAHHSENDIAQADYPRLRYFAIAPASTSKPRKNVKGQWYVANSQTVQTFSAVAYYFARDVHKETKVPIGVLECSAASTSIRGWISRNSLREPVRKFMYCRSSSLFNGMIAPITSFGITGIVWYQGETDIFERSFKSYQKHLAMLINDWRGHWNEGTLPFFCVQLPNFSQTWQVPTDSAWAELREAQYKVCSSVPNTYLAVSVDIAKEDPVGLHPLEKEEIGRRLAQITLAAVYGKGKDFMSPSYDCMNVTGNKALISFQNVGKGLICNGTTVEGFAISGSDKVFYWADADIQRNGREILVSSKKVPIPIAVRYAWADNPKCNLYSKDNLPVVPFRTDNWKTPSKQYIVEK
jgi:sialate O-acetylesterase